MAGQTGGLVGGFVLAVPPPGTAWSAASSSPCRRLVRPGRRLGPRRAAAWYGLVGGFVLAVPPPGTA
ncbi:hypothetical protein ABZ654_16245 [Streptomyces hygroscopicus]|uniref:hypothetical protein n=1 Tax=Streptomyces hygroscopicus TaxID=1912 RepID=UPI0034016003